MKYTNKVIVSYIGIIFITSGIYVYFNGARTKIREGMGLNDIGRFFDSIGDFFSHFPDMLAKPFKPVMDFISKVSSFFATIPSRIKSVDRGFEDIGQGIKLEFVNLGKALRIGGDDIGGFLGLIPSIFPYMKEYFIQYVWPRLTCSVQKVKDFRYCFIYYVAELIGQIIYSIHVRLPLFILYSMEDQMMMKGNSNSVTQGDDNNEDGSEKQ
jgi:hypothetical protein